MAGSTVETKSERLILSNFSILLVLINQVLETVMKNDERDHQL